MECTIFTAFVPGPPSLSEPFTEILGGSDVFIDQHSTINLTCIVHTPDKPAHVFWLRNGKVRLTRQPASFTMKNSF